MTTLPFPETVTSYARKCNPPVSERAIRRYVAAGTIASVKIGALLALETPESTQLRLAAEQGKPLPDRPKKSASGEPQGNGTDAAGRSVTGSADRAVEPALA